MTVAHARVPAGIDTAIRTHLGPGIFAAVIPVVAGAVITHGVARTVRTPVAFVAGIRGRGGIAPSQVALTRTVCMVLVSAAATVAAAGPAVLRAGTRIFALAPLAKSVLIADGAASECRGDRRDGRGRASRGAGQRGYDRRVVALRVRERGDSLGVQRVRGKKGQNTANSDSGQALKKKLSCALWLPGHGFFLPDGRVQI